MPYCPKCGAEVEEGTELCPKCGASLKVERRPPRAAERVEKREKEEKREKREKSEKEEKREKEEVSPIVQLAGGLILTFLGVLLFMATAEFISFSEVWPYLLIFAGVVIVVAVIYAARAAVKRHPRP